jgi:hypothetical protein
LGKNLTIYLPDDVAEKMEKFPEVNWSEICRKAVTEYVKTRSQIDLAPILERLKKERSEDFRQGQLVMYTQIIPKMKWKDIESLYPTLDKDLVKERSATWPGEEPLSDKGAEFAAIQTMRKWLQYYRKERGANVPKNFSDAYAEGAIEAFMDVYRKVKPRK